MPVIRTTKTIVKKKRKTTDGLQRPLVIFSDMDGCISPKQKIWREEPTMLVPTSYRSGYLPGERELSVTKPICDYDGGAISLIRKLKQVELVFISGDERINRAYAKRQSIPFIYTGEVKHSDKWEHLEEYWREHYKGSPKGKYIYLGDSIPDFHCLMNSGLGFYPEGSSVLLKQALYARGHKADHVSELDVRGGDGVIEAVLLELVERGKLRKATLFKHLGVE